LNNIQSKIIYLLKDIFQIRIYKDAHLLDRQSFIEAIINLFRFNKSWRTGIKYHPHQIWRSFFNQFADIVRIPHSTNLYDHDEWLENSTPTDNLRNSFIKLLAA